MTMKKTVVMLLTLVLLLCAGCAEKEPAPAETVPETSAPEATVPETMEATIPVPDVADAIAQVNGVPAVLATLSRGDTVDVVDSYDEKHVVVKTEQGYGLVEKNLIRMTSEPAYEAWTGYAGNKSELYDNFRLTGEPVKTLQSNAQVEVLDDLGYCYLVRDEDTTGYIALEKVSKTRQYGGSSGGGGGGSGSGADGGDIHLQKQGGVALLALMTPQEGTVSGQAAVLADGTEIVLGYFDRNDTIPVVVEAGFAEVPDGFCAVYLDGLYAFVPENLIYMEGDEAYAQWDGFSKHNAIVYDNCWLLGTASDKLQSNTSVHVLYELDHCYFVEVEGQNGFIAKEDISQYRYSSGGKNSGGAAPEWSPPAL